MAEIIRMPRLSDTMEEGTVVKWFKKVGDLVKEGEILAEIETDKATMEFESFSEGELLHIGISEGETAAVDKLLAIIGKKGEDISDLILKNKGNIQTNEDNNFEKVVEKDNTNDFSSNDYEIIKMPRLSDTMEEGKISKWFKKVGDLVKEGEILAEIETDKATMEFESFHSGYLLHIGIKDGETSPVDSVLAIIGAKSTNIDSVLSSIESTSFSQKEKLLNNLDELRTDSNKSIPETKVLYNLADKKERIIASPLAKRMASEKGIDISKVKGSGENGRVIKRDIEKFNFDYSSSLPQNVIQSQTESIAEHTNSQMRKSIAKRLSQSKFSAPHYYLGIEFNVDNLISFRKQHNDFKEAKISFNDIIIKATAKSLKLHPEVNSRWYDDKIVQHLHVNIGVAVAVDDGLVVPVIRFADEKSLLDISLLVKDMANKARSKKLTPSDMDGSTFTISNLGMFGISEFTSIINQPNSAILSVGAINKKAIVKNDKIEIGSIMKVTLACDHRSVDGATGSAFLNTLRGFIENPVTILL